MSSDGTHLPLIGHRENPSHARYRIIPVQATPSHDEQQAPLIRKNFTRFLQRIPLAQPVREPESLGPWLNVCVPPGRVAALVSVHSGALEPLRLWPSL